MLQQTPNLIQPAAVPAPFPDNSSVGGNVTQTPRIGLVIRFLACDTELEAAESGTGMLVAGQNNPGHFGVSKALRVSWHRTAKKQLTIR